jgi:hypothetical protein
VFLAGRSQRRRPKKIMVVEEEKQEKIREEESVMESVSESVEQDSLPKDLWIHSISQSMKQRLPALEVKKSGSLGQKNPRSKSTVLYNK